VTPWWAAVAENMVIGPSTKAPFDHWHLLQAPSAAVAREIVSDLEADPSEADVTLLALDPMPARALAISRATGFVLSRLPKPRRGDDVDSDLATGGVNPTPEQARHLFVTENTGAGLQREGPLLVLNLNLHKERGIHPDTGEEASGRELAGLYFKKGISTFMRLGARIGWAGRCRGALLGDGDAAGWDQVGLIVYPSRQSFLDLLRVPSYAASGVYRTAGLERSWVVHSRAIAASHRRDVAPLG
ncbi:MAG: hypothetical protein ACR2PQ_04840, partial [Myxococcota bacterium]